MGGGGQTALDTLTHSSGNEYSLEEATSAHTARHFSGPSASTSKSLGLRLGRG